MSTNHACASMMEWSSAAQMHALWSRIPSQISLWFRILPMFQSILFLFSASSRMPDYLGTFPVSNNCREKMLTTWIKTLNHQLLTQTFWLQWVITDDLKYIQEEIEYHEDLCDPHINPWLGLSYIHISSLLLRSWFKTLLFSFKHFRPY